MSRSLLPLDSVWQVLHGGSADNKPELGLLPAGYLAHLRSCFRANAESNRIKSLHGIKQHATGKINCSRLFVLSRLILLSLHRRYRYFDHRETFADQHQTSGADRIRLISRWDASLPWFPRVQELIYPQLRACVCAWVFSARSGLHLHTNWTNRVGN